jgi:hypothetical protein
MASALESLAEAEAARKTQQRKRDTEQRVKDRLEQLIADNHLADLMRAALGGHR